MVLQICPACKKPAFDLEQRTCQACGARSLPVGGPLPNPTLEEVLDGLVHNVKVMLKGLKKNEYQQLLGLWQNVPFTQETALLAHRRVSAADICCMQVSLTIRDRTQYSLFFATSYTTLDEIKQTVYKLATKQGCSAICTDRPMLN